MPTEETENLLTNNFLKRNSPNEILISKNNIKFEDLEPNSIIGTSFSVSWINETAVSSQLVSIPNIIGFSVINYFL